MVQTTFASVQQSLATLTIRYLTLCLVRLSGTLSYTESFALHFYHISSLAGLAFQLAARPNNPTLGPNHLTPPEPHLLQNQWTTQSEVRTPSHERVRLRRVTKLTLTQLGTPIIAPLPSNDMQVTTVPLR